MHRLTAIRLIAVGLLLLAGLGTSGAVADKLTVMLEFYANPTQAPLYVTKEKGFFRDEGLEVEMLVPGDPTVVPKLVAAKKVDVALTNLLNHIILKALEDLPVIAVGSLIQNPLGGLLAIKEAGIEKLVDLKGKKIGFSVEPIEPALYQVMLASVGLKSGDYELVKFDFLALLPALLTERLQAIGAFRNFEPVAVELRGKTPVFFAQEDYGAPNYYELIFIAHEGFAQEKAPSIKRFLRALARGVLFTLANPAQALELFFRANPALRDELNKRAYYRTVPLYAGAPCHNDLERWAKARDFLVKTAIIKKEVPLTTLLRTDLLPEGCL